MIIIAFDKKEGSESKPQQMRLKPEDIKEFYDVVAFLQKGSGRVIPFHEAVSDVLRYAMKSGYYKESKRSKL